MIIVHYLPFISKSLGGVPAYINLISRDLGKLCELHVITHKASDDYDLENCKIHYIPNRWLPWNNCKKEFLSLLKEIHPDVFHTNACWDPLTALTSIWAKNEGYKVAYTPHGELTPYSINRHYWTRKLPAILLYQKRGLQAADIVHTTADKEKKELAELGWNTSFYLIPNCIQIDQISIKETWKRKKKILFISRIHHKKGIHFLIKAISILKKELNGYKVYIVGKKEDNYFDELVNLTKNLKVADIIEFTGPIYGEAKWNMYKDADVFVLPTFNENFGIVIPEALASGTPTITTIGAPWEELNTYKCGWWIENGTQPLVDAFKDFLCKSSDELKEMGQRGRELIINKYTSESIAKQFIEMYNTLIAK